MSNRGSSCPVSARYIWLSRPLFGAARISQAIAPRNGGVTNEAVTKARTVRPNGMSVRATSQPIGAATAQQMTADDVAMIAVVISGSRKLGSVNRRWKFSKVNARVRSVKPNTSGQDIGKAIGVSRIAAKT